MLMALVGCSEREPNRSVPALSEDFPALEEVEEDYADGMGDYPKGWRTGVILVKVNIHQNADVRHEDNTQGGVKSHAKWSYSLEASQQLAVMVPPDFTLILPDYKAKKINAEVFKEDLYIETADTPLKSESRVTLKGLFEVRTPNANELTYMLTEMDVSGSLTEFNLQFIRPSKTGKGYEASVHLEYKLSGSHSMTAKYLNAPLSKNELECCESEPQYLEFFPDPDLTLANRIDYTEDGSVPPEMAEMNRQLTLNITSMLQQISAGLAPRAVHHPNMRWKAEPNQLTLSYHSESEHLIAQGGLFSMAAPAKQRSLTLEIILKAND